MNPFYTAEVFQESVATPEDRSLPEFKWLQKCWQQWSETGAIPINVKTKVKWVSRNLNCVHGSEKSQLYFHETKAVRCSMNC